MFKNCTICKKRFKTHKSEFERRKCCSRKCSNIWKSKITKGRLKSEEHKRKIALAHKGKKRPPFSKEWRENMSKARRGKKLSEQHRLNLSKSLTGNPNLGWAKGKKFSKEHRKKMAKFGKAHANWKGGKIKREGYILIYNSTHPSCNSKRYVFEHRLVMEKKLGRYLQKGEKVHHLNGIKDDNRPENLQLVVKTPHYGKIECPFCRKHFLIR